MTRLGTIAALLALTLFTARSEAQAPPAEEPTSAEDQTEGEGADTLDGEAEGEMEPAPFEEPAPRTSQPPPPPPGPPPSVGVAPAPPVPEEDGVDWLPSTRPLASFGIGLGWTFPGSDVLAPNTVAARFRLKTGLAIEPSVAVEGSGSGDSEDFTPDQRDLLIGVGLQLRVPVASAGPIDFLILGNIGLGVNLDLEPGDTTSLSTTLGYGLGLELWLTQRFSIGMDATNPLVNVTWVSTDDGFGDTRTQTDWVVGVVWAPRLRLLATLYF